MDSSLLLANSSNRIRSKDAYMLMALWMEMFPIDEKLERLPPSTKRTGCILVSPQEKVLRFGISNLIIEHNGAAHAIHRAILNSKVDPRGCDLYVSRFPCSMCVKLIVQAGIRKCYYFPSAEWELHGIIGIPTSPSIPTTQSSPDSRTSRLSSDASMCNSEDRKEKNRKSVYRLISNNNTALSAYIPQWDHSDISEDNKLEMQLQWTKFWTLDEETATIMAIKEERWTSIKSKFTKTLIAISQIFKMYNTRIVKQVSRKNEIIEIDQQNTPQIIVHAIVMAHIAARRTDDIKIGVGAIILSPFNEYISIGWNGYPSGARHLDYPQSGADDSLEDEQLKYDYILHAEQNALLWRNSVGCALNDCILVSTKLPCDECSPMISDLKITTIYTNRQKSANEKSKRGLTYEKCHHLIENVWIFNV